MTVKTTFAASAAALLCALQAQAQTTTAPAAPAASPPPAASNAPASAAPAANSPNLSAAGDIAATIKASPKYTILAKALDATNLTGTLKSTPNLTLFAPPDEAFNALPPATLAAIRDAKSTATLQALQKILAYHLVAVRLDEAKIKGAKGPVPSAEGQQLQVDGSATPPKVNNADILQSVNVANNGVIHVIDKVLVPPDVTLPTAP